LAAVFVLTPDGKTVHGYFTLSSFVVKLDELPEKIAKKLTKMGEVPATLIGRLARSVAVKGKAVGELLLADALKKALLGSATVASWAVVVDAKDEKAAAFYQRYGFARFPHTPNRLFLPMNSIRELFEEQEASVVPAATEVTSAAEPQPPEQS